MMIEELILILFFITLFFLILYTIYKKKYFISLIMLIGTIIVTTQIYSDVQSKKIDSIFSSTSISINLDGGIEQRFDSNVLMDNVKSVIVSNKSELNYDIDKMYDLMSIKCYHNESFLITLFIKSTRSLDDFENIEFDSEHIIVRANSKVLDFNDEFYSNFQELLLEIKSNNNF